MGEKKNNSTGKNQRGAGIKDKAWEKKQNEQ